jgi:hypothetical protein
LTRKIWLSIERPTFSLQTDQHGALLDLPPQDWQTSRPTRSASLSQSFSRISQNPLSHFEQRRMKTRKVHKRSCLGPVVAILMSENKIPKFVATDLPTHIWSHDGWVDKRLPTHRRQPIQEPGENDWNTLEDESPAPSPPSIQPQIVIDSRSIAPGPETFLVDANVGDRINWPRELKVFRFPRHRDQLI